MENYFLIDTTPPQSQQEQNEALKHVALEVAETCNRLRCDAIRIVESCTLIRKGRKCGIINKEGRIIVPIEMYVIIPPVNSQGKLFCTKDCQGRWGAVDENGKIRISYGTYHNMWGFDHDLCLVDNGTDKKGFTDRAIIDSDGNIIVDFGTYSSIWDFYAKPYSSIVAEREDMKYYLSKENPLVIIKEERNKK